MALKNFSFQESYTNIKDIRYCKHGKYVAFSLHVSDSKFNHKFSIPFHLSGGHSIMEVQDIITSESSFPQTSEKKTRYIYTGDAFTLTNPLFSEIKIVPNFIVSGMDFIVEKTGEETKKVPYWELEPTRQEQTVYVVSKQQYYRYRPIDLDTPGNGIWETSPDEFDAKVWNKWFALDTINKDSNLYTQIYSYLKSRSDFVGVSDV